MSLSMPPEWAQHERVWIGFPSHEEHWPGRLDAARSEVAAFARAVHAGGKGEAVHLIAATPEAAGVAKQMVEDSATVTTIAFGDIWLRDTGPIIVGTGGQRQARDFAFNGWGGKFRFPEDQGIGAALAATLAIPVTRCEWVFEGGSIDTDGGGLGVTTVQCVLNPNRNPGLSRADIEQRLARDLGIARVLWLGEGLGGDHTDGHVDNLARFVGPNLLAIPEPAGADDPNAAIYADAAGRAALFGVDVVRLPSPGRIERDGEPVPASYMNFYIGNAVVAVPVYGAANDRAAVDAIAALFPGRAAVPVRADTILMGGGSLHCISQQVPA